MNEPSLECVLVAADPAHGWAVCDALKAANIGARAIAADDGVAMEVYVPAAEAAEARRIIRQGHWPRLA